MKRVFALALLLVIARGAAASAGEMIAFTHVNVVPMDREIVLFDHTVIVADGRIAAVGPFLEVEVPDEARMIEADGKFLMPGLADMHVHAWSEADLTCFVCTGVTTVRNMFGSELQVKWRDAIANGERFGPRIYTAGPIIDGKPAVWPGSTEVDSADEAEQVVLDQKAAGYDFIKVYSRLTAEAFAALAAAGKKHGMRVMGHVPDSVTLEHAVAAGQESIEHFTGVVACCQRDESRYFGKVEFTNEALAWKQVDDEKLAATAKLCAAGGAWNCPTLVVMQKWSKGAEAAALRARPEMRFVDPQVRAFWDSPMMYLSNLSDAYLAISHMADQDRKRAVKIFHDAGAPLITGTDMGNPYVVAGFSLHEELSNFVAAGLTPYETLRASTADAAKFMRADSEWGTVRVGLAADLILVDGNPLEDVANAGRREGVVVNGTWFTEAELTEKLEAVAKSFGG